MGFSGGERNALFLNRGGKEFVTLSGISGADDPDDALGFAYFDYDRDGWLDMLFASRDEPSLKLFRNNLADRIEGHHTVAVRFVGGNTSSKPSSEYTARDGFGAAVVLELGSGELLREHRGGEGWRVQTSPTMLIGIGENESVDRLTVRWPSGREQFLTNVPAGTVVTAYENAAESSDGSGFERAAYGPADSSAAGATAAAGSASSSSKRLPLATSETAELSMYTSMATWCAACRRELPNLALLRDAFPGARLAMYGVPVDLEETKEQFADYASKANPSYELLADLSVADRERFKTFMRGKLHTDVLPGTVIVKRDGTPVWASPGVPTISDVRALLD